MRPVGDPIPLTTASIFVPVIGAGLAVAALPGTRLDQFQFDTLLEHAGVLTVPFVLMILFHRASVLRLSRYKRSLIGNGLISMAMLEVFQLATPAGDLSVWLHALALVTGGGLFACLWGPPPRGRLAAGFPHAVAGILLMIAAWTVLQPEIVPRMRTQDGFTWLSRAMCLFGGAGFVAAAVYLLRRSIQTGRRLHAFFAAHCGLLGASGFLFETAATQGADNWWHALRLLACLVLFAGIFRFAGPDFGSFFMTIRSRIIALGCGVAFVVAVIVGGLSFVRSYEQTLSASFENLSGRARLMAARLQSGYDAVETDARIIAGSPPVRGLLRSRANPEDGSGTQSVRGRLAEIFSAFMQEHPYYEQIRYIDLHDSGKEIVRVNRMAGGPQTVAPERLQEKGHEPHVKAVLAGRHDFFFSGISLAHENNAVAGTAIPMIRAVMPVLDTARAPVGLIVINVDFQGMQQDLVAAAGPDHTLYLINRSPDYVVVDLASASAQLFPRAGPREAAPGFIGRILAAGQDNGVLREGNDYVSYARVPDDKSTDNRFVAAALRVTRDTLLAEADATRRESVLLMALLVLVSVGVAAVVARRLTDPLTRMTTAIRHCLRADIPQRLPVARRDEIGELARTFDKMLGDLAKKELEQDGLIRALELSNKELDSFAYVASHDLKAPLRVIDNASRWLEEDLQDHLDNDTRESMSLLRNRVRRMEKLLDDLLAYSRVGQGQDHRFDAYVSGAELAESILQLAPRTDAFEVRFNAAFDATLNLPLMPIQLVLLNLVSNAIKHHHAQTGQIAVGVEDLGGVYRFSVRDDGPGIAPEYHAQVFQMFQTLRPRDHVEGSGMGLAMVKKYVEHYGGMVSLESVAGKGCLFFFTWPKQGKTA